MEFKGTWAYRSPEMAALRPYGVCRSGGCMSTLVARLRIQNGLYVQPALGRGTSFDCADERRRDQTDFGPVHEPNFNQVRP